MISNESLKKQNYKHHETKDLFLRERSQAKKHLYYAKLRLEFLAWLERGWMDEATFTIETDSYEATNLEESLAWQEAVFMLAEEIRQDEFYIDIIGNTNNFKITWAYSEPKNEKDKDLIKKILKEHKEDLDTIEYKERKKIDDWFHSIMGMKPKQNVLFHPRYDEFKKMIKSVSAKGDTYQMVMKKLASPSKKIKNKSLLEVFLSTK